MRDHRALRRLLRSLPEQVAISRSRHPARTCEMAVMHGPGTVGLRRRIESEQDQCNFTPIRPFLGGFEQAQIRDEMALVIGRDVGGLRRTIVEWRNRHGVCRQRLRPRSTPRQSGMGSERDCIASSRFGPSLSPWGYDLAMHPGISQPTNAEDRPGKRPRIIMRSTIIRDCFLYCGWTSANCLAPMCVVIVSI